MSIIILAELSYDDFLDLSLRGNTEFERWVFWLTVLSSWISASLGLAKCLKIGVAGVIGQKGPFDGLLSGRFVLAFFGFIVRDF